MAAGLRRFALPVLALALTAAAIAAVVTQRQPTTYASSVTMVVQTSAGANDTETLVRTMIALVGSEVVGAALQEQVDSPLAVEDIAANLSVERPPGSSVLTITYLDEDVDRSLRTAQAIIPVFQEQVELLEAEQAGQLAPNYAIQPWGAGAVVTSEIPAPILRNAAIAALLGALLGAAGAALYRQRNRVITDSLDAERATGLPVLTTPRPLRAGSRATTWHPADIMDAMVARLPHLLGSQSLPQRILVLSPDSDRHRVTFLSHLTRAMEQKGSATLLVDADLETGRLSRRLGLSRNPGLADCLRTDLPPEQASTVPDTGPAAGLHVLPAGTGLPLRASSPALVLRALQTARLVVDGPAPSTHQSLGPLIRCVDAVLVLTTAGRTTTRAAASITALIRSLGPTPAATILLSDGPHHLPSTTTIERPPVPARPGRASATP